MGVILYREPKLDEPELLASWSGIGNVGLIAIETLREQVQAEALGEIEPWDFFYPRRVIIRSGILERLEFPASRFYHKKVGDKELILFIGEEQPPSGGLTGSEARKGYQLANLVLDVAEKFGCRRIYIAGAAVAPTHHSIEPKVWLAATHEKLARELRGHGNTIGMSEIEGREVGSITGLNGLLLGLARKRGFEAVCLMGEIPDYLAGASFPYPRASKAVLEVISGILGFTVGSANLNEMSLRMDDIIEGIYAKFPPELKERLEQRKAAVQPKAGAITEEDENWLKEHIEELFKKGKT